MPVNPTASDDGVYYVQPNVSSGFTCWIITNGIAVQQDAVTTAALLAITGVLSNLTTSVKTTLVDAINELNAGLGTVGSWGRGLRVDGNAVVINNPLANASAYSVKNASMWAGTTVTDKFLNSNSGVINFSALPGYSLSLSYRNGRMGFATEEGSVFSGWFEFWHSGNFNPAQYVLQSSLNAQLANYATLAGTQTFSGTNTFNQAPVVPAGTLNNHAVNLGQLVNYFKYVRGLTSTDHLDTITDQGIFQQTTSANATAANGYPVNNLAGILEVYKTGSSHLRQIYTTFSAASGSATGNRSYQRYHFNGVWSTWRQVAYAGDGLSLFLNDSDFITSAQTNTLLNNKVDKVAGKQLSTEDYTATEKTKLSGIQSGAEVNVNADWNAVTGDAQILNKPIIPTVNNPVITVQGVGAIIGGGGFSLNQVSGATYSLDLQSSVKTDIQNGAAVAAIFNQIEEYHNYHDRSGGGSVNPAGVLFTVVGTPGGPTTVNIDDHNYHGAEIVLQGPISGYTKYNINLVDRGNNTVSFVDVEVSSVRASWDSNRGAWRIL